MSEESKLTNNTQNESLNQLADKSDNTSALIVTEAEPSTSDRIRSKLSQTRQSFSNFFSKINKKYTPMIKEATLESFIINIPYTLVQQSNNKNLVILKFRNKELPLSYNKRKIGVYSFTVASAIAYHFSKSHNTRFKFRWFIPFYVFYSLLICRENLDPFLI